MQEKILDFLRKKQDYVSGEEISRHLGITRQALWKHTQELKAIGYDIVAVPHLGYRLVSRPDRLFPGEITSNLNTKFIGKKIHYFDRVSSTMDIAMELGIQGVSEGTVVLAESQTKGRGRLSRHWFSPKYKGIYASLILKPKILPGETPVLTLLAGVSICEAIKNICGLEAKIKWPNDIFIYNKKLGGILTELYAQTDAVSFIAVGMGLNVNNDRKDLVSGATSLKEQKKEKVGRIELLQEMLRVLEKNYLDFQEKGSTPIIDKWRHFNITLGRRVRVVLHKDCLEGEAQDIDKDGALLLRKDSGIIEKVVAGDIVHCR